VEQKVIKAKYRATEVSDQKVVFVPVQKLHLLEQGAVTELCNFTVNLNEKLKNDMGEIKVGDLKEFQLTVSVITGYQKLKADSRLWLSIISKCLSGWGLYFFHNSRRCSFLSRRSWQICLRSFIRALRSRWRIWLCATKSACFSDPR